MSVVPQAKIDLIQFCELHVPVWTAAPAAIGLTAGQCTALDNATKAARLKFTQAEAARSASKAATVNYDDACGTLRDTVSLLVKAIKLYADNQANPDPVYAAAQIPAPASPVTNPPPGQPTNFKFEIEPGGLLTFRWKSTNSSGSTGAYFAVARRLGPEGAFTAVGGSTSKVFTDDSIPFGVNSVTYIVTPRRSGQSGTPSDMITVQFGVGGQTFTVTSTQNNGLSMAA